MKITLKEITIESLSTGYKDNMENGVVGYNGKLDIRPPFQREFVYNDKQRLSVIDTILKGYPLNVMYWAKRDTDSIPYEIIDGQQRTISVCQYVKGDYSFEGLYFHNQPSDIQNKILNYKLTIYICEGTDSEKLEWFKTINIAGEKLLDQELRNAVYHGPWLTDAKKYFSKIGCPAYQIGSKYLNGSPNRQEYLETALKWISKDDIEEYMAIHQHDQNANKLWIYYQNVITWVETTFINYRKEMKGLQWGELYNTYSDFFYDTDKLEKSISRLMIDDDVSSKRGIYLYILTSDEKHLSIRAFHQRDIRSAYERQNGICVSCNKKFLLEQMHADHITPWSKGGKTEKENCQMLCAECNRRKSNI